VDRPEERRPKIAFVDTTTVLVGAAAAAAASVAVIVVAHLVRLSRTARRALERIGAVPPGRWWKRPAALDRGIQVLEAGTASSHRDRSRLAAAAAEAPIGMVITDDDGMIWLANRAATRYLGARRGEAVGETRMGQAIEAALLGRRPVHREVEVYTPHRRYLDIEALPLEHGVESAGAVAYIRDVTETHRVDAMRSDFIANVTHELKTPLGALAVLAETLAEHAGDPQVASRLAGRVVAEAGRLSALVGDILDLSQAESGERPRAPVDLDGLISTVSAELGPGATQQGVEMAAATVPQSAMVWGDRRQLHTMLTNLVENAVKYSRPGGGEKPPRVTIETRLSKKEAVVSVIDEGVGIPEQHQERIFERFYRVDRGRSRETGGTGLGLSIARHIARNHGGDITLESQVGVGSTFRVRLPLWREP
jgi:two-component system sensor histidine kinase SenX3